MNYQVGDRVRVVISDTADSDHRYHGETGRIEEVLQDDLSGVTGDPRDDYLYRVAFDDESLGRMSYRHHDLRSVNEDAA